MWSCNNSWTVSKFLLKSGKFTQCLLLFTQLWRWRSYTGMAVGPSLRTFASWREVRSVSWTHRCVDWFWSLLCASISILRFRLNELCNLRSICRLVRITAESKYWDVPAGKSFQFGRGSSRWPEESTTKVSLNSCRCIGEVTLSQLICCCKIVVLALVLGTLLVYKSFLYHGMHHAKLTQPNLLMLFFKSRTTYYSSHQMHILSLLSHICAWSLSVSWGVKRSYVYQTCKGQTLESCRDLQIMLFCAFTGVPGVLFHQFQKQML